jgi:nitrogen fixation protein
MLKKLNTVILFFAFLAFFSCNKSQQEEFNGTVKDFTGLDGCTMMIVLDNGQRLELVSIPSNTTLIADRRVAIKYKPVSGVSICMAGLGVKIISLRYL